MDKKHAVRVTTAHRVRSQGEWDAIHRDNRGFFLRELAFLRWLDTTVYGQAVNRWIAEIGARS